MENKLFIPFNPEEILKKQLFFVIDNQLLFLHKEQIVFTQISNDNDYTSEDYFLLPEGAPFQLINGKLIFMASPKDIHQKILANLHLEIGFYVKQNKLGEVRFAPIDVKLDDKNVVQPDLLYVSISRKAIIKDYIYGAPDFVVEILSPSTEKYDRTSKLALFGQHNVLECWLINLKDEEVEVYHNKNKEMQLKQKAGKEDQIKSIAIKGLELEVSKIFE